MLLYEIEDTLHCTVYNVQGVHFRVMDMTTMTTITDMDMMTTMNMDMMTTMDMGMMTTMDIKVTKGIKDIRVIKGTRDIRVTKDMMTTR